MIKSFNMATIPERLDVAIKAIESIYEQADVIRIYLNRFDKIPKEFIRDKIVTHIGDDLNATGKLFWAKNSDEYYFCIDDDLIYPPTYSEDMIKKLNMYGDDVIISLHGKILQSGRKSSYFRSLTKSIHFAHNNNEDVKVHVIGNGVSLFNTNNIKIDYTNFKYLYMDDIMVSMEAQKQNKGVVVVSHPANYVKSNPPKCKTLHSTYVNNDSTQTEMVNSINWRII